MKKTIFIILFSILISGCRSYNNNSEIIKIEATLIAKDNLYGNGAEGINKQNLVITNKSVWNNLIAQMNAVNNVSNSFSETEIDFSKYVVIAVFDEIKSNGGYSLALTITDNSENIMVNVTTIAPQGFATTVITQPFHIVKILKSDLPIIFE